MTLAEMTRIFARIGLMSFGGPAAQIALMHKELVETRPWLSEQQFLRALGFCMLLPGPEAMQLATYAGWRMKGLMGGLIAGLLFILPGAFVIACLALAYAQFGTLPFVQAMFLGIKAVVVVIVLDALMKIARRALIRPAHWALALAGFLAIFVASVPFPAVILAAALIGATLPATPDQAQPPAGSAAPVPVSRTLKTVAIWAMLWLAPLALIYVMDPDFFGPLALFFSKLALVTFGGAYAVLTYMTQAVVGDLGWLTTAQMMDTLGLAETTPGPLILVTQFVAMLAGAAEGGVSYALWAAIITLWMTFTPCFLWIFAGAPYIDWLAGQPRLSAALAAITATIVGVIMTLALWFALHLFFAELRTIPLALGTLLVPQPTSLLWKPLVIAALAATLLLWRKIALPWVLLIGALTGLGLAGL